MTPLLVVHLIATAYMTGLIWLVQIVHYPLMGKVGEAGYVEYQRAHMSRITPVVLPAMIVELGCAVWLAFKLPGALSMIGLGAAVAIWVSTFAMQVPRHAQLAKSFDTEAHRRLVRSNWVRTILWTVRCGIAGAMIAERLNATTIG